MYVYIYIFICGKLTWSALGLELGLALGLELPLDWCCVGGPRLELRTAISRGPSVKKAALGSSVGAANNYFQRTVTAFWAVLGPTSSQFELQLG